MSEVMNRIDPNPKTSEKLTGLSSPTERRGIVDVPVAFIPLGADSAEVAKQAAQDAYTAAAESEQDASRDRYVFSPQHQPGLEFEIRHPSASSEPLGNPAIEQASRERRLQQKAVAAQTPEAQVADRELAQAIAWNGQAVAGVRDFVEAHGMDAPLYGQDTPEKWDLAA